MWETGEAKVFQQGSSTVRLGRGKQPPASPSCASSFAANRATVTLCPGLGTGPPAGLGAAWSKGTKEEEDGGGGEAHPCAADGKLEACFSKINSWPSEADILPPKEPGQDSTLSMHKNTPFSPSVGPEGRKSLVLDSKLPMAFPGLEMRGHTEHTASAMTRN